MTKVPLLLAGRHYADAEVYQHYIDTEVYQPVQNRFRFCGRKERKEIPIHFSNIDKTIYLDNDSAKLLAEKILSLTSKKG